MERSELVFTRPPELQATTPAEYRGLARDEVRLMVSRAGDPPSGLAVAHIHTQFANLADYLQPGDLLVVNRSATLPASLPAVAAGRSFRLHLSTHYGRGLWLAEPRWSYDRPGPLPLAVGEPITVAGAPATVLAPFPGLPRLRFVQLDVQVQQHLHRCGEPIRYSYVRTPFPLAAYQTIFGRVPGSAEMPSAGRPFTRRVLQRLKQRGVQLAGVLLHTGVSSLEVEADRLEEHPMYAEPFVVPPATAAAVNQARCAGRRVIAVGTTVVRALESAWAHGTVRAARGFTRVFIHPGRGVATVDGLLSGFHDPLASHLAMLYAIGGQDLVRDAYAEAVAKGYLWHEFGDSHLILRR
jgi:S-adenosylmethionine:tRNA ribosyltransferase-isomerase